MTTDSNKSVERPASADHVSHQTPWTGTESWGNYETKRHFTGQEETKTLISNRNKAGAELSKAPATFVTGGLEGPHFMLVMQCLGMQ